MSNYRETMFQVGTVQDEGRPYETTTYLTVETGMGPTPRLTADTWGGIGSNKDRHEQVRVWLNKEQWAELAAFAAKMAEDERIPVSDEREDVQYFNNEAMTARIEAKREAAREGEREVVRAILDSDFAHENDGWAVVFAARVSREILDGMVESGEIEGRQAGHSKTLREFRKVQK